MRKWKWFGLSLVLASLFSGPMAGAQSPPRVDVKQVEMQFYTAQSLIIQGDLEKGLQLLHEARAKATTAALVAHGKFVTKLAEVRMAAKLRDADKVLALLDEGMRMATGSGRAGGCWQLALALAKTAVAEKDAVVAGLLKFLDRHSGTPYNRFASYTEMARLRIAAGNAGAAEAALRKAAQSARPKADWTQWMRTVGSAASLVDGGRSPGAGRDLYERLRKAVEPREARVRIDIAEGRFLLRRKLLSDIGAVLDRAVKAGPQKQIVAVLTLAYDAAAAAKRAGSSDLAVKLLAKAEDLANALPSSPTYALARSKGLLACGLPVEAASVAWKAAKATRDAGKRTPLLIAFGTASVAAGKGAVALGDLKAVKGPPGAIVGLAAAMVRASDPMGALAALDAVAPEAVATDARLAREVGVLMHQLSKQRKEIQQRHRARCLAISAAFEAGAKKADSAKQAKEAAALRKEAARFRKLSDLSGK